MSHRTIVSTDTLASHLSGAWVIVDCRFDLQAAEWGREQYLAAHIPGAVYASLNHDLAGPRTGTNGRHPLPSIEALTATLGRLGIGRSTQVVAYDQDSGMYASRLWWMLRYMGHDAVAVLDGGWAKWTREERPARSGDEPRPAVAFAASPRPELRSSVDDVTARLHDGSTLLVDARGPERYEGRSEPIDRVAGHIPGAVNRYYKSNATDDGTLLPPQVLRATFLRLLGDREPAQAVMYCGSGVTACHNLLAMEHAGLTGARLFAGSWSEWSADPTRPVEKGPSKP
ncbi:MAG TPA: sulfurtransferase [Vicinamibacterales bacterium]|nr:sulfurtransferase [Vicinamibacterales bacterium]